ncbi:MAG: manganese efflux pump [Ruminococcaceae bacterium]|nr:manganese efflux pump [Oscillospiraceae bacterium]
MDYKFFLYAIGLGVSLAMDAFSVSLANGLGEPRMRTRKVCLIAGMFALFQALMPLLGWICLHTVVNLFSAFEKIIPWISLALLGYIGGKMLYDGIKHRCEEASVSAHLGFGALLLQAIATSIDALTAGLAFAEYDAWEALLSAIIIALITFIICLCGVLIGKRSGTRLCGKAGILGGVILIIIGLEIFITSWF